MSDIKKLLARIGTARGAISRKEEQTSLDYMIDGVLMNCSVMLKEQEAVIVHDPGAFCPRCGWMLYPEDHPKFCGNCGQTLKWELLK